MAPRTEQEARQLAAIRAKLPGVGRALDAADLLLHGRAELTPPTPAQPAERRPVPPSPLGMDSAAHASGGGPSGSSATSTAIVRATLATIAGMAVDIASSSLVPNRTTYDAYGRRVKGRDTAASRAAQAEEDRGGELEHGSANCVEAAAAHEAAHGSSAALYAPYRPVHCHLGFKHPDPVVETAALSGIEPPQISVDLSLKAQANTGQLSSLQLESISYAIMRFEGPRLPTGECAGFFLGDGAGVGKGRQIAGLILEHKRRGGRRALWLSVSTDLKFDARRDIDDIDGHVTIYPENSTSLPKGALDGHGIRDGLLFCTYSLLVTSADGVPRMDQIANWLKKDEKPLIILDECHKAKNLATAKGQKSTKTAEVVVKLQRTLPDAWVLYCSATGVSEPDNLHYMSRLGTWGFDSISGLLTSLKAAGMGAMELFAMGLKASGAYVCRTLAYEGAEFELLRVPISPEFQLMYDRTTWVWQLLLRIYRFASQQGCVTLNRFFWPQFWGNHMRFFRQMLVAAKVKHLVASSRKAIDEGMAVVIGLQSTGEAHTMSQLAEHGEETDDFVSAPRMILERVVKNFPIMSPTSTVEMTLGDLEFRVRQAVAAWKGTALQQRGGRCGAATAPADEGPTSWAANPESAAHLGEFPEFRHRPLSAAQLEQQAARATKDSDEDDGLIVVAEMTLDEVEAEKMRRAKLSGAFFDLDSVTLEDVARMDKETAEATAGAARAAAPAPPLVNGAAKPTKPKAEPEPVQLNCAGHPMRRSAALATQAISLLAADEKRDARGADGNSVAHEEVSGAESSSDLSMHTAISGGSGASAEARSDTEDCGREAANGAGAGGGATIGQPVAAQAEAVAETAVEAATALSPQVAPAQAQPLSAPPPQPPAEPPPATAAAPSTAAPATGGPKEATGQSTPAVALDDDCIDLTGDIDVGVPARCNGMQAAGAASKRKIVCIDLSSDDDDDDSKLRGGAGGQAAKRPAPWESKPVLKHSATASSLGVKEESGAARRPGAVPPTPVAKSHSAGNWVGKDVKPDVKAMPWPPIGNAAASRLNAVAGSAAWRPSGMANGGAILGAGRRGGGPEEPEVERDRLKVVQSLLMELISLIELPPNPLDDIIEQLGGPGEVAEMTGRQGHYVRQPNGSVVFKKRRDGVPAKHINLLEREDFREGRKKIAIISEAASTGISLHADKRFKNQLRRVHFTLELPWSAEKAVQQFGRSHRSNQASAPIYKILITPCAGERRFASAAAKRLQSLGAMMSADRRAMGAGVSLREFDIDNKYGHAAVKRMYEQILGSESPRPTVVVPPSPPGAGDFHTYCQRLMLAVGLMEGDIHHARVDAPSKARVDKFLNRLLGLPLEDQKNVFAYFSEVFDAEVQAAKLEGKFDDGIVTLSSDSITFSEGYPKVIFEDPVTKAVTKLAIVNVDKGVSWAGAVKELVAFRSGRPEQAQLAGWYRSTYDNDYAGTGKPLVILAMPSRYDSTRHYRIRRPYNMYAPNMFEGDLKRNYRKINDAEAEPLWNFWWERSTSKCLHKQTLIRKCGDTDCGFGRRMEPHGVVIGAVVQIWRAIQDFFAARSARNVLRVVRMNVDTKDALGLPAKELLVGLAMTPYDARWLEREAANGSLGPLARHDQKPSTYRPPPERGLPGRGRGGARGRGRGRGGGGATGRRPTHNAEAGLGGGPQAFVAGGRLPAGRLPGVVPACQMPFGDDLADGDGYSFLRGYDWDDSSSDEW